MTGASIFMLTVSRGALVVLLVASLRDLRNSSGRIRSELGYFLLGSTSILVLTLGAYQILRFFVPPSQLFWFAPLRAVTIHADHRLRDFHAEDHGRRSFSAARDYLMEFSPPTCSPFTERFGGW